ncbi:hypothetical protein [Ensifer sp. SSB1]|uniref:hypothetical protein n=1 Tax=Ensifer sp. SSB1 TaxID=2795385 RepID=UPI001A4FB981|nr:hypothetical protein [Ensifer sp. SSB1]MBK5565853.1 hypothetical protein [Ensifer sp. SSB1]
MAHSKAKTMFILAALASVSLIQGAPAWANGTSGYTFEQGFPTAETSARAYDDADLQALDPAAGAGQALLVRYRL